MAKRYTLTPQDSRAIINTAARLGIEPDVLTSVMAYETMGTMNPTIKGGKGGNYQGLIQFGPPERRRYGFDADASFAEQVEGPVYRYLKDRGVKPGHGVAEVYSIINAGSLKNGKPRWGASDGNGTVRSHVQNILSRIMPRAAAMLQGAAPSPANMDAIADVANYSAADGGDIYQPEVAVAASPESAGAAINELQLMASGPPNALPVDAMAYNQARVQVAPPLSGSGQSETLVGGIMPPTPRERPTRAGAPYARGVDGEATGEERWSWLEADAQPPGAPGVADLLMPRERPSYMPMVPGGGALGAERPEAGVPLPNLRPQRGESLTRAQDYISGDASQMTPDAMTADLYRSGADQMPTPRVRPPHEVDMPLPRPRPGQPALPPMVAGRPEFPGSLPAAPPAKRVVQGPDGSETVVMGDDVPAPPPGAVAVDHPLTVMDELWPSAPGNLLGPGRVGPPNLYLNPSPPPGMTFIGGDQQGMAPADPAMSQYHDLAVQQQGRGAVPFAMAQDWPASQQGMDRQLTPPPLDYDRMTREREQFNADMEAGTLPQRPIYSPDFSIADPGDPALSLVRPPTQGAVFDPSMARPPVPSGITTANSPFAAGVEVAPVVPRGDIAGRFEDAFEPGMVNAPGRFADAFAPPVMSIEDMRRPSFADWMNSGGTEPAEAALPPVVAPKDQSKLPASDGPVNTGNYGKRSPVSPPAVPDATGGAIQSLQPWDQTFIPQASMRVASGDKSFVPLTYSGSDDPVGATGKVTKDGADYPNIYSPPEPTMVSVPKPTVIEAPKPVVVGDMSERFETAFGPSPVGPIVLPGASPAPSPIGSTFTVTPPAREAPVQSATPGHVTPPSSQPRTMSRIERYVTAPSRGLAGVFGSASDHYTPSVSGVGNVMNSSGTTQQKWTRGTFDNGGMDRGTNALQTGNSWGGTTTAVENPWGGGYLVSYN